MSQPDATDSLERLGVAGSGTVACGVAAAAALRGLDMKLWSRSAASADRAERQLDEEWSRAGESAAGERVELVEHLADLGDATVVVEAVREDEFVKRDVFGAVAAATGSETLFATTTSSLSIEALSAAADPARFFGLHVFTPVTKMDLVELCFSSRANGDTRSRALALCAALGKTAVEVPDEPGFVVNRLLFPYLFDAVRLLERTGMDPAAIDDCMKLGAAYRMGPLELLDFVGLDVADAIGEAIHADTGDAAHRPPGRIKQLVGEGRLGRKSGAGFYTYD
jgi:3-hydroxybutyryl-CoA dehydrogenase